MTRVNTVNTDLYYARKSYLGTNAKEARALIRINNSNMMETEQI